MNLDQLQPVSDVEWRIPPVACSPTFPAGVGSTGPLRLDAGDMDAMLRGGARRAVERGYGSEADLDRIEESGCMAGADPSRVSEHAKRRHRDDICPRLR